MKILALTHVFPRDERDPSAPFLLTWARALQEAGADVTVVAPHDAGLPMRDDVAGVTVRRFRYGPSRWEVLAYRGEMHHIARRPAGPPLIAALLTGGVMAVRSELRRIRPDLLHVHWWLPGMVIARLARPAVPVVCTVHGTDVALLETHPLLRRVARWALQRAGRVEAVSSDLAKRLERVRLRADAINPMPLGGVGRPPGSLPPPSDRLRLLAVGRMVPEKGFADLLDAVTLLDRPTTITLVGEGPERVALTARALSLGIDARLPGQLDPSTLSEEYASADIVVQPSHREGLGLVAAEAVLAGIPVVATDSGGVRDVLPAETLVPAGDPAALAARIEAVAADLVAARAEAAAAAARLGDRLSPAAAAARTLAGYEQLRAAPTRRRT